MAGPPRTLAVRIAAVVGALFSALSVVAGTRVLTGVDVPGYVVLPWLVWYNVMAGLAGVAVGAALSMARRWANAAVMLAAAHGSVLVVLIARRAGGWAVASDSLGAMTLRTVVWSLIALIAWRAFARPARG